MAERGGNEVAGMASASGRGAAAAVLALAVILAGAVTFATWQLSAIKSLGLLVAGAVLAFIGLLAIFSFMAGFIRIDRQNQTRAFFDGLTDAIGDACVVMDGKSRAVYGNAHFLQLASKAGVSRLVGFDLLYAGQAAFVEPIYQLAQAALEGKSDAREIRLPAGSTAAGASPEAPKWLKISVAPLSGQGKRGFVLWRLQDVSVDRARQEKAFGRLQFIITYLDHAPAGFFSTLPSQKIDYLNATLAEWLGIDIAESQNGNLQLSDILGETGAKLLTAIEPLAGGGRTELFSLDLKTRKGAALPVEVIHRVDFDAQSKALPARTLIVPRREQTQNEDSEALSRFVGVAPIGIAEIDSKGIIQSANPVFLSYSARAKRGASLASMVVESDRAELRSGLDKFQSKQEMVVVDATIMDEKPRLVQFSFARLQGMDHNLTVFAVDKTESKTLEVQLAQSQKMQAVGQLASGIAQLQQCSDAHHRLCRSAARQDAAHGPGLCRYHEHQAEC